MIWPKEFPRTRASLIASMRDEPGASAWEEFFRHYAPPVFRVARLRGLHAEEADDIVQQVMITITHRIGGFAYDQDRGKFRQWVRTIAENKIKDYRRRCARDDRTTRAVAEEWAGDPNEAWERQWRFQDLMICLDEMTADVPLRHLEAFRRYVIEGEPVEDVAEALGMSVGNVYVVRTRIIRRIRERMGELNHGDTEAQRRD